MVEDKGLSGTKGQIRGTSNDQKPIKSVPLMDYTNLSNLERRGGGESGKKTRADGQQMRKARIQEQCENDQVLGIQDEKEDNGRKR